MLQITPIEQHRLDLANKFTRVFLVTALDKKYPNAAKEFIWQWLFPAVDLTREPESGKRATTHTFRQSFARHLLQANVDIGTIQEFLGHSDLKTNMIYTHIVESVTIKEAKSPLDF